MPYLPSWEKLADALKRVESFGTTTETAKVEICQAIADRNIPVRVVVATADHAVGGKTVQGSNLNVPQHLGPSDFNWDLSRPLDAWGTGPYPDYGVSGWSWEARPIELIEVSTDDLIHVLGNSGQQSARSGQSNEELKPISKNRGGRPRKYDWDAFYTEVIRLANTPDGLPDERSELNQHMKDWCATNFLTQPDELDIRNRIRQILEKIGKT